MRWVFEHRVVGGERENGTAEPGWRTGSRCPRLRKLGFGCAWLPAQIGQQATRRNWAGGRGRVFYGATPYWSMSVSWPRHTPVLGRRQICEQR